MAVILLFLIVLSSIVITKESTSSKDTEMMDDFIHAKLNEDEMRAMAKEKFGERFTEEEFNRGISQLKRMAERKEAFSYEHKGFEHRDYMRGPLYEEYGGYSKEHMVLGMIFQYIGDDIDPREIKQLCNEPNKIVDEVIGKLKDKVGDLQNICKKAEEEEARCSEYSSKACSQIGTMMFREGATEEEKTQASAYACPIDRDRIVEACISRGKRHIEQQAKFSKESCEKRFGFEGERLFRECEKFKQSQVCDKDNFIKQCLANFGVKKEDFDESGKRKPICPAYPTPQCPEGTVLQTKVDSNGCNYYYCEQTTPKCPEVSKPTCNADERLEVYYDNSGCISSYQCIQQQSTVCPTLTMPTCKDGETLQKKADDRGCTYYHCEPTTQVTTTGNAVKITGRAVLTTYDDYVKHCESSSWQEQERICANTPDVCDKSRFIEKCQEQEKKNYEDLDSKIELNCETQTLAEIQSAENRCNRIEEDKKRCIEESSKRCEHMEGVAEKCRDQIKEENLRKFIVEEAKKRCKFSDIINDEDEVRKLEKVEIILAVLNTATKDDIEKLELFVDNLQERLRLQDTTVYRGTIDPNRFGDIKLLPFIVNAKISTTTSSESSKEVKEKIVAGSKVEEAAGQLVSLRDSDVPDQYLYIIEDKASDLLDVSKELENIEKEEGKGLIYKIKLFLGLAKKVEEQEINKLQENNKKLQNSIDTLTKLTDDVPSDVAKAVLKEQVENLKARQKEIDELVKIKEKKAKGIFG